MAPLLLLLLACGPAKITLDGSDDTGGSDSPAPPPEPTLAVTGPQALDRLLAPTVTWALAQEHGDTVFVELSDATGTPVRQLADGSAWVDALTLDGLDEAGQPLPVGAYTAHIELWDDGVPVVALERELWIVRVGVTQGTLGGDRVALCWHAAGGDGQYFDGGADTPTFVLGALESEGVATAIPEVWADLDAPPEAMEGANLPAAYPYDAVPTLALTVGGELAGAPVHARIAGWTADAEEVAATDVVTFTADAPLATSVGVVEPRLTLEWMVGDDVFATQEIPLRMYALFGPPTLAGTTAPYLPWVAVVDPLLRSAAGAEPTFEAVAAAVVDHVYWESGLQYDTRSGASAYTQYRQGYNRAIFDLTSFLGRRRGSTVNCTDCASIVETFGKMIGLDLSYAIILSNFDLNYILAIGGDAYTHCPFGRNGCGFSYHAVVTPDDTSTILDATLALDGDDDPSSEPNTEMMVHSVDGEEYLYRLVMSGNAYYDYVQHGDFQ